MNFFLFAESENPFMHFITKDTFFAVVLFAMTLTAATLGDLDPLHRLLEVVTDPFVERPGRERYAEPAPEGFGSYRTFCGT